MSEAMYVEHIEGNGEHFHVTYRLSDASDFAISVDVDDHPGLRSIVTELAAALCGVAQMRMTRIAGAAPVPVPEASVEAIMSPPCRICDGTPAPVAVGPHHYCLDHAPQSAG